MITQKEIRRYLRLEKVAEQFEKMKASFKERMTDKEKQETGALLMVMLSTPTKSVAYKVAIERLRELHPDMSGAITKIVDANTKPVVRRTIVVEPVV